MQLQVLELVLRGEIVGNDQPRFARFEAQDMVGQPVLDGGLAQGGIGEDRLSDRDAGHGVPQGMRGPSAGRGAVREKAGKW